MYTIHRTESYILKSSAHGEANKRISLLTKDLGVIQGTAQGVRHLKSKLRYSLTDFARVEVALVRGKDTWRIVNASKCDDIFIDLPPAPRLIFLRIFSLISRLITGETEEPHIFGLVRSAHVFINNNPDLDSDELTGFENILVLQLLHYLGYVGEGSILDRYKGEDWNKALLQKANNERRSITSIINHALEHTGL